MTTEEAATLVLQAAALNAGHQKTYAAIYVLEMGEPVNIARLARQLIRLRGLVPDRDIAVNFTGLRPGEKLSEVITGDQEHLKPTQIDGVLHFTGEVVDPPSVERRVEKLHAAIAKRDRTAIKKSLGELIPNYTPNGGLS